MKTIELDIMDEIDRICRDHGLTYFLGYGSALGAVRHGGFIPWDDDMDLIMPRNDYEKLIDNFSNWCKVDHLSLIFSRNGSSVYQFVKIIDTRTIVKERYVSDSYKIGIWVDIFPLDGIPKNKAKVFQQNAWLTTLLALSLSDPNNGTTPLRKAVKKALGPLAQRLDPVRYARKIDDNARLCQKTDDEAYLEIVSMANQAMVQPKEWFTPLEVPFEDRHYFIPANYEEYLTLNYGDWRTPPPKDQRQTHTTSVFWAPSTNDEL